MFYVCVSVCLSVCLSLAACPHYSTDPDVTCRNGWQGVHSSCALLGEFAIGARVSLLWQHSENAKCQRVLVLALWVVITIICEIQGVLDIYYLVTPASRTFITDTRICSPQSPADTPFNKALCCCCCCCCRRRRRRASLKCYLGTFKH